MSKSFIAIKNPARDLLSTIIRQCGKRMSKKDMLDSVQQYGDYVKAMDCDKNLIADTIKEFRRSELLEALNELYSWYFTLDCIAARQKQH